MKAQIRAINFRRENDLATIHSESQDVIVLSSNFRPNEDAATLFYQGQLTKISVRLLEESVRILKFDGQLFVYGSPAELPSWGERLSSLGGADSQMVFRNWIALDISQEPAKEFLKPSQLGLLLFAKARPDGKLRLKLTQVRVPHKNCAACDRTLKDWGGKKHWMHPEGAALSDVWRDLPRRRIRNSCTPEDILKRILEMTAVKGIKRLHIIQKPELPSPIKQIKRDRVYRDDCVAFLNRVSELHPKGLFDLAFADPPYNLAKDYESYGDQLVERHYIEWCNSWLSGMARTLKPGGSLFVLNLPKWAIHHATFLNRRLEFRHWIAWDALSDPRGKLMPAHYALLYYTKPGAKPVFNYSLETSSTRGENVIPPDSPKYCLRAGCVRARKEEGNDDKVELSDIWFDIHRIKHKRDRDAHPCQLPDKLMERIIRLTTNRGGLVFDPFCGAGTTAIAARKLGRHFVVVDSDTKYVSITNGKLAAMEENVKRNGHLAVPRNATRKIKREITKKSVEIYLQDLAKRFGRLPAEKEIKANNPAMLAAMDELYPNRGAALKRAKVALADRA